MRLAPLTLVSLAAVTQAVTLDDVCSFSYIQSKLPPNEVYPGITISDTKILVNAVYNSSTSGSANYPATTIDYCNVTLAYSHNGRDDEVLIQYWLPSPEKFENRYLSTGGAEYDISQGSQQLPGGVIYGAVSGATDGGFGGFDVGLDEIDLLANGTLDWQAVYMFGYQAHHELSTIGKSFTKQFFNMTESDKLYAYYQSCSEGGREGWSQVQRFGDEWDGAVIGAPALRYSFQMVAHLWGNLVEKTLDYYPPPCEFQKIVNLTIAACDPLDGRTDGVVARSDLCKLHYNINSTVGEPYYCAAASDTPVQKGTVTSKGVEAFQTIIDGMKDTDGRQIYLSYQPGVLFYDAQTQYNSTSQKWEVDINSMGAEYVLRFLDLVEADDFTSLDGITYDTLKEWVYEGWQTYSDSLHTTWPDLTPFHEAGGKVIHYHGEQDGSMPTGSSVHYYESVRRTMYPKLSYNESNNALGDWYRFFLVPGASHCMNNDLQPNGPFPQTSFASFIDWVENGVTPITLNGTVLSGELEGQEQQICAWPLRPMWKNNGTTMECEYDQQSIDTWMYEFDAFKMPVY